MGSPAALSAYYSAAPKPPGPNATPAETAAYQKAKNDYEENRRPAAAAPYDQRSHYGWRTSSGANGRHDSARRCNRPWMPDRLDRRNASGTNYRYARLPNGDRPCSARRRSNFAAGGSNCPHRRTSRSAGHGHVCVCWAAGHHRARLFYGFYRLRVIGQIGTRGVVKLSSPRRHAGKAGGRFGNGPELHQ